MLQKIKYLSFFIKEDMMEPLRYLIVACSIGMVFLMLLKNENMSNWLQAGRMYQNHSTNFIAFAERNF